MGEWTREELSKRSDDQVATIGDRIFNRLAKWRSVFAGWQLGTQLDSHGPTKAIRNHREATMLLRAEVNAISALLIEKGVITSRELTEQMIVEAEALSEGYENLFPGMSATDDGISYLLPEASETMKRLGFPS